MLQWSYNQVKEWNKDMRAALLDRKVHAYQEMYLIGLSCCSISLTADRRVVFARKPLSASAAVNGRR